jgi:ribosomal protein S6
MIKGMLVIDATSETQWKVVAEYVPAVEEKPNNENIQAIIARLTSNGADTVNVRRFPYKFFSFTINKSETGICFAAFILENTDSLEIVRIFLDDTKTTIGNLISKPKELVTLLKKIMDDRNLILEKLDKPKMLQDEIGAAANKLIDSGNFEDAQNMIKLAKEVPGEIFTNYKRGTQMIKDGDFKKAEKAMMDARDLSNKIRDSQLSAYFSLKLENVRNLPNYEKELKTLYSTINKNLAKNLSLISYGENIPKLRRSYEILDSLENDDKMTVVSELDELIQQAEKAAEQLSLLDKQIKALLGSLN